MTGITVPVMGVGCAPFGFVYNDERGLQTQDCVNAVVAEAVKLGCNFFDTSPYYGDSESRLGVALERCGVDREGIILATKCGRYGKDEFDFSAERIQESARESLRRLKTSYLDILQLHDIEFANEDHIVNIAVPALCKLKEHGLCRYIGITGLPLHRLKGIIDRLAPRTLDVIISYCHYCLIDTTLDVDYFKARSIGVINASVLSMGLLTMQGPPTWHPAPPGMKGVVRANAEMIHQKGFDISRLAIKWALQNTDISVTLVGLQSAEEVRENAKLISEPLTNEEQEVIDSIDWQGWKDVSWPSGNSN